MKNRGYVIAYDDHIESIGRLRDEPLTLSNGMEVTLYDMMREIASMQGISPDELRFDDSGEATVSVYVDDPESWKKFHSFFTSIRKETDKNEQPENDPGATA